MPRRMSANTLPAGMARHLRDLGCKNASEYQTWCSKVGVPRTLDKSPVERAAELEIEQGRRATTMAKLRAHRNPRRFLAELCAGKIDPADVDRPVWREVAQAVSRAAIKADDREDLRRFLLHLERVSDLVLAEATLGAQRKLFLEGVLRIYDRRSQWFRDPTEWRPDSHNVDRQFSSLLRHLFARFETPRFLDAGWLRADQGAYRFRDWFIHIGLGKNIRKAKTHYPLTKMTAHYFVNAPDDVSIEGALMHADIRALGGSRRLVTALMGTRLGRRIESDPERRAFWLTVYRFFVANPLLDLRHAGPIIDYLRFQKFETQEVMVGPGQVEKRPPPQPELSMARRAPANLLRQVAAWHGELQVMRANDRRFWRSSSLDSFAIVTGASERPETQKHWRLRELLSGQELIDEGKRLRHCVATYAESCARGRCSIWSLECRQGLSSAPTPCLTVEIDADRTLIEARGLNNRWPTGEERRVLDAWMREEQLTAGPFLYGTG